MSKRLTQEEFETRLKEINPDIKVLGGYINSEGKIKCQCLICNHEWKPKASHLLEGHGCPNCANKNKSLSLEEISGKVSRINPNIIILNKYKNKSVKSRNMYVKCKCKICGHEWGTRASHLFYGRGCPKCSGKIKLTQIEFEARVKKIDPNIKVLGEYVNMTTRIKCACKKCDNIWEPIPNVLLQTRGCPICSTKRRIKEIIEKQSYTHEEFLRILKDNNPHFKNIEFLEKFKGLNSNKTIKCKCKICGHEWSPTTKNLAYQVGGCPKCAKTSQSSYPEIFIFYSLYYALNDRTRVEQGDTKAIGKELDIYLPEYKTAVEVGSWYFHKKIFDDDLAKAALCSDNNINLITIYEKFNEDIKLPDNFYAYPTRLTYEKNHKTLKEIVCMILNKLDIEYVYSEEDWKYIEQNLYYESDRLKLERFKELFNEKNLHSDTIEILNEHYTPKKIQCRCKICGREWVSTRSRLLKGTGCDNCARKKEGLKRSNNAS